METLTLTVPADFRYKQTIYSHGWFHLKPHTWDAETHTLGYVMQLDDRTVWHVAAQPGAQGIRVELDGGTLDLTPARRAEIESRLRWMFRLDEDYSAFYAMCSDQPKLAHTEKIGAGRILRCASLWEDLGRSLMTTNTTWTLTKRMVARLVDTWGTAHTGNEDWRAFPSPEVIAQVSEADLKAAGLGYRADYLLKNAQLITNGVFDLEGLRDSNESDAEIRKRLLSLRGVGDYVAGTLMILLGRYTNVPVDTEARAAVSKAFYDGQPVTDKQVKETLAMYQPYAALVLYCLGNEEAS